MNILNSFPFYELSAYKEFEIVLGIDEAGRGSLAGPVSVSCISFQKSFFQNYDKKESWIYEVNDSKKLTENKREILLNSILKNLSFYRYLLISSRIIDKIGINAAIEKAILIFIRHIVCFTNYTKIKFYIDGNYKFLYNNIKDEIDSIKDILITNKKNIVNIQFKKKNKNYLISNENIIKGDEKVFSIACASILSKVKRDQYMKRISILFPDYNFQNNKGYGTKEHLQKIEQFGQCFLHRKSYNINFQYRIF
ncbi:MAG: ribonuclease HII [Leptospiraceae bacterium]|nr:MAG: ribonuclease HII [Leptospiraceae bacterium]